MSISVKIINAVNKAIEAVKTNHEGIPEVVVTLAGSTTKHGHFAPNSWKAGEDAKHEIFLSAESLSRGPESTLGTILHELVHAYCHHNDIRDTSNNGVYHNGRFRDTAIEFGIDVEQMGHHGWTKTSVPEATTKKYTAVIEGLREALVAHRVTFAAADAADKPKQKVYKMSCADCNDPVSIGVKWFERNMPVCACGEPYDLIVEE